MATIQRPTKEGSVRTYQEKVGLGYIDILASEMDADLDTIYAAWNGGVDSVTLKDGAVTTPKLVDAAVTLPKLVPGVAVSAVPAQVVSTDIQMTSGTPATILTISLSSYRGGTVLVSMDGTGVVNLPNTTTTQLGLYLLLDGVSARTFLLESTASAGMTGAWLPLAASFSVAFGGVTAGNHTISVQAARLAGTGLWIFKASSLTAVAFA
jgi:hypothetical protein